MTLKRRNNICRKTRLPGYSPHLPHVNVLRSYVKVYKDYPKIIEELKHTDKKYNTVGFNRLAGVGYRELRAEAF